jgi:hypothetical protein
VAATLLGLQALAWGTHHGYFALLSSLLMQRQQQEWDSKRHKSMH